MDAQIKRCTGVILAGGENTRMPVRKAFIEVEGQQIIRRNLSIINRLFSEVFIVTNEPEQYTSLKTPLLGDVYDIRGPMTGILSALLNSSNPWVFVSACDMPFINKNLIAYMAAKRDNMNAVVPMIKRKAEPLFAFYSKRLLTSMEKSVRSGRRGLKDFLNTKRVQYITTGEVRKVDPETTSFINLNTPGDIDLYLKSRDRLKFKKHS